MPQIDKLNDVPTASNSVSKIANNISGGVNGDSSAPIRPVHSAMIIRAGTKGEERVIPLSHTGMVVRAVAAGTGISATNVIAHKEAIFKTPTENFLYRYANSTRLPVMLMPRFNSDAEDEVRKILETDIVVYDTDDEDTVAIKESVAALKQDLLKAISEGYNAAEILNAMREDNNRRVRSRVIMQRELNGLIQSNMVDEAIDYFNNANSELADNFLPPLVFDEAKLPKNPDH